MDDFVRCDLPEFNQALSRVDEAVMKVQALLDKVEHGISETCISSGFQVVTCKNVLLSGYLAALCRFALERVMGTEETEAVTREAIKLRLVYEKANVLEKRLKHQIETALTMVIAEETQTTVTSTQPAKALDEPFDGDEEEEEEEQEDNIRSDLHISGNVEKDITPVQGVGTKGRRLESNESTSILATKESTTREREREQYHALRKLSNNPIMQDLLAYYEDRPTEEIAGNARLSVDQKLIDYEEEAGMRLTSKKRADLEKAAKKQLALTTDLTETTILNGITKLGSIISGAKNTLKEEDGTQALINAATRKANKDLRNANRERKSKK